MMTIKTRHNLQHRRTAISQTSALQDRRAPQGIFRKSSSTIKSTRKNKHSGWIPKLIPSELRLPLLSILVIGLLLLGSFFGYGDTSYYYYSDENSVYESREYGSNRQVEGSKKESKSVKSNIPGMKEQDLSDPSIVSFGGYK
jgi:hypothetical protein